MPLINKFQANQHSQIGIWEITESFEELITQRVLSLEEEDELDAIKNLSRRKQWLISRLIVKELTAGSHVILHSSEGVPYLKDKATNISISHTTNFVAVIISDISKVGVDIESINERVLKVKHKFISDEEQLFLANPENNLENICLAWSAKEALFKIFATADLDFKKCINLEPYNYGESKLINATVSKASISKKYTLEYQKIKNHFLVYVTSEI